MEKSIYTSEYAVLIGLLRKMRQEAGLTQVQFAKKLRLTQSLYSKMERGECRVDLIQMRTMCRILGVGLKEFVARLERELSKSE